MKKVPILVLALVGLSLIFGCDSSKPLPEGVVHAKVTKIYNITPRNGMGQARLECKSCTIRISWVNPTDKKIEDGEEYQFIQNFSQNYFELDTVWYNKTYPVQE